MDKYVCIICGFIYDEAKAFPKKALQAQDGKTCGELLCPLERTKSEFNKQGESALMK